MQCDARVGTPRRPQRCPRTATWRWTAAVSELDYSEHGHVCDEHARGMAERYGQMPGFLTLTRLEA